MLSGSQEQPMLVLKPHEKFTINVKCDRLQATPMGKYLSSLQNILSYVNILFF
jgi:hypothetical protein